MEIDKGMWKSCVGKERYSVSNWINSITSYTIYYALELEAKSWYTVSRLIVDTVNIFLAFCVAY